ncbi:MAG: hypothetical protein PWQ29_1452 [Verrucomicrobiota bacterium]|nr:hypothetical protein [Verrucomicrobiota bacterium]
MNFLLIAGLTAGTVSTVWSAGLTDDPMDEEPPMMDQPGPGMRGRSSQDPEWDEMRMHSHMGRERMQPMDQQGPGMRGRSSQDPEWDEMRMHSHMGRERMQPMDQPGPGMRGRSSQDPERGEMRMHSHMSRERMQQMRAERDEIMRLGEAARNETDPVKKEKLVGELRSKLSIVDDQIHEMHQARLEQAEQELAKLREKMEQAEENREQRIDNMVERILSKEPMGPRDEGGRMRPDHGKYPDCPPSPPMDE